MTKYTTITSNEALALMARTDGIMIIDVRTRDEFAEAPIPDAFNFPLYEMLELLESDAPPSNRTIIVHCESGRRSQIAAQALAYVGYTNVYTVSDSLF